VSLFTVASALLATVAWSALGGQMATADRIKDQGWWPTKGTVARGDYVGAAACTPCHRPQSTSQPTTAMARTANRTDRSEVLRGPGPLTFDSGGFHYEIAPDGAQSRYTVATGSRSSSAVLTWAFGVGNVGQSFLFAREGAFYEARVSYYESIHGLAFTPGRAMAAPRDLDEAMARRVDEEELRRCFGCHTTAPTADGRFDASRAVPGVTCEACHGPGRRHVEAMEPAPGAHPQTEIFNPAKLQPEPAIDFCGACHATFWDVKLTGDTGIAAMRSQPYRLRSSRCWNAGDARITCTACHEPHSPLVNDPQAYDKQCLACHVASGSTTSDHPGRACPVKTANCVDCHMPKYPVPDMHHEFTDHLIRVPRR